MPNKDNHDVLWIGAGCVLVFLAVLFLNFSKGANGKLQVVFCNVGQGDAIYLKTPKGLDILVDGGPDERVLDCLSHQMPFWDRTIEMIAVSHPQADHITGLISVLKRYQVESILIGSENNVKSPEYTELKKLILNKNIIVKNPYLGQKVDFSDRVKMDVLWPKKEWLADRFFTKEGKVLGVSNIGYLDSQNVLGAYTFNGDLNLTSTVLLFRYGSFDVLLTGDADISAQPFILKYNDLASVDILKIPHHGSKNALTNEFLQKIKPQLAVISVGKNSFGHPVKEIIKKLTDLKIPLLRTDLDGEIKIVADGERWEVK